MKWLGATGVGGLFEAASRWNTSVFQPLTHKSSSLSRREESVIVLRVPLSSKFHIIRLIIKDSQ